jgi:hypothetical protein
LGVDELLETATPGTTLRLEFRDRSAAEGRYLRHDGSTVTIEFRGDEAAYPRAEIKDATIVVVSRAASLAS